MKTGASFWLGVHNASSKMFEAVKEKRIAITVDHLLY